MSVKPSLHGWQKPRSPTGRLSLSKDRVAVTVLTPWERRMENLAKLYELIKRARRDGSLWPLMAFLLAFILLASVVRH